VKYTSAFKNKYEKIICGMHIIAIAIFVDYFPFYPPLRVQEDKTITVRPSTNRPSF
jgi:hypothetical protein